MTALSGVRSSWLITARKSLFAWLAASACALAAFSRSSWRDFSSATLRSVTSRRLTSIAVSSSHVASTTRSSDTISWPSRRTISISVASADERGWPNSWPTRSSAGRPNSRSAAGLANRMIPCALTTTIPSASRSTIWRMIVCCPRRAGSRRSATRRSPTRRSDSCSTLSARSTGESLADVDFSMSFEGGVSRQDAHDVAERLADVHPRSVDRVPSEGRIVPRAAHLEQDEAPEYLSVHLGVAQQDDRIGERGDVLLGDRAATEQRRRRRREQARRLLHLQVRGEADDELAEAAKRRDALQGRQAVHGDTVRLDLGDKLLHLDEVILHRHRMRIAVEHHQPSGLLERREVESPRRRVAEELILALLEGEEQAPLARGASARDELRDEQRLARPGRPRREHDRVAEESASAHLVQRRDARGDADAGRRLRELDAGERNHDDPVARRDREGEYAALMRCAADLEDLDRAAASLVVEQVAEDDDVVGDELLDAVARDLAILVHPLAGEDDGQAEPLERGRDAEQLGPQDRMIRELDEQGVQRVEGDALGAVAPDRSLDARQERTQVERSDDGRRLLGVRRGVDEHPLAGALPPLDVPSEPAHVGADVLGPVLEGDEDARLSVVDDPGREEVRREHRLGMG